jgi:hypothetical protein
MTTDATEAWSELVRRAGEAETWRMRFEEARGLALRAANACPEAIIRLCAAAGARTVPELLDVLGGAS